MGKGKAKLNIPICAALALLLLTVISFHLTSGLFARYRAMSSSSDSARVARFDVDATVQAKEGSTDTFTVAVTNHSEVAVKYSIVVHLDAALDAEVSGDGVEKHVSDEKTEITFTHDDWALAPNGAAASHTLTFSVTDWTFVTKEGIGNSATKESAFTVDIVAEQID